MTQDFKLISSIEQRREADIVLPPICPFFPMSADFLQSLLSRYARRPAAKDQAPTG